MKKVYTAPKAETLVIEAKDIITSSRMLGLHSYNDEDHKISEISWKDFAGSGT